MNSTLQLIRPDADDITRREPDAEIVGRVVTDGVRSIMPDFDKLGSRLTANAAYGSDGVLVYSPTLDSGPDDACRDSGVNVSPAGIIDGWAELEADTFAEINGYVVLAGNGSPEYIDGTIHGSEIDALGRAFDLRGEYDLVEVKRFVVRCEAQDGRLAFYDARVE